MPHALSVPFPGFQAIILCGPGVSLNTFTANPEDFPKALVPIANRPMVWYPLDWCYRMGITSEWSLSSPDLLCMRLKVRVVFGSLGFVVHSLVLFFLQISTWRPSLHALGKDTAGRKEVSDPSISFYRDCRDI